MNQVTHDFSLLQINKKSVCSVRVGVKTNLSICSKMLYFVSLYDTSYYLLKIF